MRKYPVMIGKHLGEGLLTGPNKKMGGADLHIGWLKEHFDSGESFPLFALDKIDVTLHFCDIDSVERMIEVLTLMKEDWLEGRWNNEHLN